MIYIKFIAPIVELPCHITMVAYNHLHQFLTLVLSREYALILIYRRALYKKHTVT